MSTSCHSSRILKESGNRYRFLNCVGKFSTKSHTIPKLLNIKQDGDDLVLVIKSANRVEIIGSTLLVYPAFWDSRCQLTSKLIYRDSTLTIFEVKQPNNKVGYTLTAIHQEKKEQDVE